MLVYKVVCDRGFGQDTSYQSIIAGGSAITTYRVGVPAYAPAWLAERGYHLCAFSTVYAAQQFCRGIPLSNRFIFTADVPEADLIPFEQLPVRAVTSSLSDGFFYESRDPWPTYTVMCKSLTLIERR